MAETKLAFTGSEAKGIGSLIEHAKNWLFALSQTHEIERISETQPQYVELTKKNAILRARVANLRLKQELRELEAKEKEWRESHPQPQKKPGGQQRRQGRRDDGSPENQSGPLRSAIKGVEKLQAVEPVEAVH